MIILSSTYTFVVLIIVSLVIELPATVKSPLTVNPPTVKFDASVDISCKLLPVQVVVPANVSNAVSILPTLEVISAID